MNKKLFIILAICTVVVAGGAGFFASGASGIFGKNDAASTETSSVAAADVSSTTTSSVESIVETISETHSVKTRVPGDTSKTTSTESWDAGDDASGWWTLEDNSSESWTWESGTDDSWGEDAWDTSLQDNWWETSSTSEVPEIPGDTSTETNADATDLSTETNDGTADPSAETNAETADSSAETNAGTDSSTVEISDDPAANAPALSTATPRYNPDLVLADGRRAYDYTTPPENSVFDYYDFSINDFVDEVESVYFWVRDAHLQYGNSTTLPPCEDGLISDDRLVARSLWNLGNVDQPAGGVQAHMEGTDEETWFSRHGFIKVNDPSLLQRGDIVLMQVYDANGQPTNNYHHFVLVSYDPTTQMCEKFDCGQFMPDGQERLSKEQPFYAPLAEFGDTERFVCAFRLRQKP